MRGRAVYPRGEIWAGQRPARNGPGCLVGASHARRRPSRFPWPPLDPGRAGAQDHSGARGDPARPAPLPSQQRTSGSRSRRCQASVRRGGRPRGMAGAKGGGVCPAYALRQISEQLWHLWIEALPDHPSIRRGQLCHRLLGRPASESGRLRHGDGGHGSGDRRRRAFMSSILPRSIPRDRRPSPEIPPRAGTASPTGPRFRI
jgi:hypothetical protein